MTPQQRKELMDRANDIACDLYDQHVDLDNDGKGDAAYDIYAIYDWLVQNIIAASDTEERHESQEYIDECYDDLKKAVEEIVEKLYNNKK